MADTDIKKLAAGDVLSVVFRADHDGKVRVSSNSMQDAITLEPDQVAVPVWRDRKIVLEVHPASILCHPPSSDSKKGAESDHQIHGL